MIVRDLIPFGNRSSLSRPVFDEMDRALNEVFGRDFFPSAFNKSTYPKMNVYDHDGNLNIDAYVPEVPKEKLKIQINENIMTISGSSDTDKKVEDDKFYCRELSKRSFSRSIQLPEDLEIDKVSAEHKDGMLKVSVPYKGKKGEPKSVREIKIG